MAFKNITDNFIILKFISIFQNDNLDHIYQFYTWTLMINALE